jgi:TolB-like protein/tetratricopeptide (TPR) repeat protein
MIRRLAAILAADIAGYSRLMHADEEGTYARFTTLMSDVIERAIAQHAGRIVKRTGDGFLAEFPSAVEAAKCSLHFQTQILQEAAPEPEDRRLAFRVGIHLGDVIVEEHDIYGDGVNVAARLEALAEPGGIMISGVVHENVRGRVSCVFEDLGDQVVKNIAKPLLTYRMIPESARPRVEAEQTLALPDKPSIAVLPFQNMSGDPGQEYFVDGMTEEIITALSRVPSFFVVARHSTFAYKGTSPSIRHVGRELGVRYMLEGSVRKSGERVRITVQLVDATTGMHIWADRFDGVLTDIFELQDRVAASVVGAIEPRLRDSEIERARLKPTGDLQAYDLVLRGRFAFERGGGAVADAIRFLRHAVEIDPDYSLALALLAFSNFTLLANHRITATEAELDGYVQMAHDAVRQSPDDPEVLVPAANLIALPGGDFRAATAVMDRACILNGNSTEAWAASGLLRAYLGEIELALDHLERSRRLNPRIAFFQHVGFTVAHFVAGKYDEAVNWTAAGLSRYVTHVPLLRYRAASLGLLGRTDEARQVVQRMLAIVPDLTIARARRHVEIEMKNPYKRPGVSEAYYEGLRRAGLPE